MKADARSHRGEEPGREELQALLRQWGAPPPPGLEDALRREFRKRRRSARPFVAWAAIAAGLALAATGLLVTVQESRKPGAAGVAEPRVAATAAPAVVAKPVAAGIAPGRELAEVAAPRARRAVRAEARVRDELEIVVEPGQAELLSQLGRHLWQTRQAAPGTQVVAMPDVDAPTYRAEWEPLAGVWPQWQQSVSDMGR